MSEIITVTIIKEGVKGGWDYFVKNSINNLNYGPFNNIRSATMYAAGFKSALALTIGKRIQIIKTV